MERVVKIGTMPGRINEFVLETGISIKQALRVAELDASGFEVKVDGVTCTNLDSTTITNSTNLILLVKKVKGNR